jgi:hypothetical protein
MCSIITPLADAGDEYGLVAIFNDKTTGAIVGIQDKLLDLLGDAIWLTPARALHSTLMEIICDFDYGDLSRRQIYDEWHTLYGSRIRDTLAVTSPFKATFDELHVSQKAIILKSSNTTKFNEIRGSLLSEIKLPHGTKLPPDITHITLARFNREIELDDILLGLERLLVNISVPIDYFVLMKNLGPPSFKPKIKNKYLLS